ncbi:hypothetical protein PR202_gb16328 [Eleusine coracana subsp. coracana]|uniref:HTH OST-type domain-containing protein n=1 Tax=Eleusine coracana subsp. coracana TaxID=191504 RepID=A0AAV5EXT7_ELECO|nr:hypothetical protein QOZ80_9BG0699890 [Eleusine coracana subsp. coracana]GJN28229.1 hypothetical protein PR202_gb16328 [Eleusine coracana subsp. coracana]
MLTQALPSRARLLLLPYARSAHHGHILGLRGLSSHAVAAAPTAYGEHQRHRNEEAKAVKVTVWWDFQMCGIPPGVNPFRIGPRVSAALRGAGIRGPVEFNAVGDVTLLPRNDQEVLAATGFTFSHVPYSGKGSCDPSFMADLIYWIAQNPPPAHFFLISGDKEFANILHRLRMSNYNILLACPEVGSKMLRSAATIMWPWEDLIKGVDLTPKHVNQPPDGLSNSWYGHYNGPVDIQLLKSKDLKALPRNTKIPEVPKSIIKGIRKVLRFHPEGISLPNLRAELVKAKVSMDRELVVFKKFSALLEAMPDVVKFIDPLPGDCQPAVVGAFKTSVEPSEQEFNERSSTQSSNQEKHLSNKTEREELSSLVSQSSSSDLSSCTQKKTLEADVPSAPSDQLSSGQRRTPDLTTRAKPHSDCVGTDVSLVTDVPLSDALSRDQRNAQSVDLVTQTESQTSHTEADMVAAASTTLGEEGNISKKGLLERILLIWNGPDR